MSNTETKHSKSTFLYRVYENDALRKGIAAAVAGLVVAMATEAIWARQSDRRWRCSDRGPRAGDA